MNSLLRWIANTVQRVWRLDWSWLRWHLAHFVSRSSYIRRVWLGGHALADAQKIALLVHYDKHGRFLRYFDYMAAALNNAGFAVVVISNSPKIDEATLERILPHCAAVIHRKNIGHDFGAWRQGLEFVGGLTQPRCLIMANDSVFGPLFDLKTLLQRCDLEKADVWGITDSYQNGYHLQSYFMLFGEAALSSKCFRNFWRRLRYTRFRRAIIRFGEIGLTKKLLDGGLRVQALFPYAETVEAVLANAMDISPDAHPLQKNYLESILAYIIAGRPLNQTHYFWDYLITKAGCPFLKRDLITRNPVSIPFIVNWRSTLRQSTDFPIDLIEEYLKFRSGDRIY